MPAHLAGNCVGLLPTVACRCGLRSRRTSTAARLLVHHRAGVTIVEPDTEAAVLALLPLGRLRVFDTQDSQQARDQSDAAKLVMTLRRWGLRTLGELAALSPSALTARLGQDGVRWQRLARGEDPRPLVPALPEEQFEQVIDRNG